MSACCVVMLNIVLSSICSRYNNLHHFLIKLEIPITRTIKYHDIPPLIDTKRGWVIYDFMNKKLFFIRLIAWKATLVY